ncbi:hypothetical protein L3X38_003481 [Prunus dulcis]|uniref:Uncharacterized protein n=1 Tax=Prunus dulcis TaxID=3755 RepID=A0AAD4ZM66_PRUDU|nr:hypothetical protein L3X38_003481 [Prunus dulcis]
MSTTNISSLDIPAKGASCCSPTAISVAVTIFVTPRVAIPASAIVHRQGSQAVKMSTGWLYLKPPLGDQKQGSEDNSKANTDQQNSNSSKSASVSTKTLQPKNERGKKKDMGGRGNDFSIVGNNITGKKSERVGIFEFGNTHIYKGHGKE